MGSRLTRAFAAVLLLAGGIIHYNLWSDGYRQIPKIGPLLLANFIISIVVAGAVIVSRRASVALAGMAFAGGSLVALVLSRTSGLLGFTERIWTAEAINVVASETGAILTLGLAVILQIRSGRPALNTVPVEQRRLRSDR